MKKVNLLPMVLMSLMIASCGKSGPSSSTPAAAEVTQSSDTAVSKDIVTEDDDIATGTVGTENTEVPYQAASISATSSLPALALSFKTNVSYMNLTTSQKTKYNQAVAIVKKVIATEAFRTKVLNFTYAGVRRFVDNKGRTNAQIYQSVLDAAETLKPIKNNTMDIGVKMYYASNSVVGYTSTAYSYINVNTKFFSNYTANQVAGNLMHEWLHKLGYSHDASATASRPYSVPYAIGYMIRDLGKSFL